MSINSVLLHTYITYQVTICRPTKLKIFSMEVQTKEHITVAIISYCIIITSLLLIMLYTVICRSLLQVAWSN